jgi:hypothetical protein
LAAKCMWRSLFGNGLWHEVIIKKYLKILSMNDFLRKWNSNVKGMSNFWKALYDYFSIVIDWLDWNPGTRKDIRIGLDPLIGSHYYYKFSENLFSLLHSKGIFTLDQVFLVDPMLAHMFIWKISKSLELVGEKKQEFENYVRGLKHSGFILTHERDKIFWSWENKLGNDKICIRKTIWRKRLTIQH